MPMVRQDTVRENPNRFTLVRLDHDAFERLKAGRLARHVHPGDRSVQGVVHESRGATLAALGMAPIHYQTPDSSCVRVSVPQGLDRAHLRSKGRVLSNGRSVHHARRPHQDLKDTHSARRGHGPRDLEDIHSAVEDMGVKDTHSRPIPPRAGWGTTTVRRRMSIGDPIGTGQEDREMRKPTHGRPPAPSEPAVAMAVHHVHVRHVPYALVEYLRAKATLPVAVAATSLGRPQ